jgi:hypothetical protein
MSPEAATTLQPIGHGFCIAALFLPIWNMTVDMAALRDTRITKHVMGLAGGALLLAAVAVCTSCGTPGSWQLNVENLTSQTVVVQPWSGGPTTTLGCQQSVTLHAGVKGAPDLPWHIVLILEPGGQVILDTEATAQLPSQAVIVEPGTDGNDTALMRQAGGSLAYSGGCEAG